MEETGTVFRENINWDAFLSHVANYDSDYRRTEFDDFVGGDHVEDVKAWMSLGEGERLPDL